MKRLNLYGDVIPEPPPPKTEVPIETEECDHCYSSFPVDDLKEWQGCLHVCDECYDHLEAQDKEIREEYNGIKGEDEK
jgi:hypothetical protein